MLNVNRASLVPMLRYRELKVRKQECLVRREARKQGVDYRYYQL